jgi:hypothetical protein
MISLLASSSSVATSPKAKRPNVCYLFDVVVVVVVVVAVVVVAAVAAFVVAVVFVAIFKLIPFLLLTLSFAIDVVEGIE